MAGPGRSERACEGKAGRARAPPFSRPGTAGGVSGAASSRSPPPPPPRAPGQRARGCGLRPDAGTALAVWKPSSGPAAAPHPDSQSCTPQARVRAALPGGWGRLLSPRIPGVPELQPRPFLWGYTRWRDVASRLGPLYFLVQPHLCPPPRTGAFSASGTVATSGLCRLYAPSAALRFFP